MIERRIFIKELTPAEVGAARTHEKYIRFPNDFDYEKFFTERAFLNGSVLQVNINASYNGDTSKSVPLKFVYYANSNKEKRMPSLGFLFDTYDVKAGDVFYLEAVCDNFTTNYNISFRPSDRVTLYSSSPIVYIERIDDKVSVLDASSQDPFVGHIQQIYFGAPGTGKSFKIDSNESITEHNSVRTTFHPDSDYSTFVGCYKPVKKAPKNQYSNVSLDNLVAMANEITSRPAGDKVGLIIDFVTKYAERLYQIAEENESIKSLNSLLWNVLGFSNETYLAKVIEKTIEERNANAEITYEFVPQAFTTAYLEAWKNLGSPYYLIIEEINRGNCAQIFGDIFQLLDRDSKSGYSSYKITPDKDLQNYIAAELEKYDIDPEIKSGAKMQLPGNLSILATMNTSDQSLFPIDSAFKRRWEWKYIPINYNDNKSVIVCGGSEYSWNDFLQIVNSKIESVTQSEDKKLGAWFVKADNAKISAEKFVSKVIFYLWNDIFKDFAHDGNSIFKEDYNKFHKFFDFTGEVNMAVLDKFLLSLGLTPVSGIVDSDDDFEADYDATLSSNGKKNDDSMFSINGNGSYNKGELAFEVVKMFVEKNKGLTATEVVSAWAKLNIPVSNLVITEERYNEKKERSKENLQKFEKRFNTLALSDGSRIYITKGFTIDTILQFNKIVNIQSDWGIHIERVS